MPYGLLINDLPKNLTVFHWHNETCDIPKDAVQIEQNPAYVNQESIYSPKPK